MAATRRPTTPASIRPEHFGKQDEYAVLLDLTTAVARGFSRHPTRNPENASLVKVARAIMESEDDWPDDEDDDDAADAVFDIVIVSAEVVCARCGDKDKTKDIVEATLAMAEDLWQSLRQECATLDLDDDGDDDEDDLN